MNERIRELAFQAGFVGESMNPIFGTCQETALKNFAELIVRECCKVSDEIEPLELSWKTSRFVKLHFGIEE